MVESLRIFYLKREIVCKSTSFKIVTFCCKLVQFCMQSHTPVAYKKFKCTSNGFRINFNIHSALNESRAQVFKERSKPLGRIFLSASIQLIKCKTSRTTRWRRRNSGTSHLQVARRETRREFPSSSARLP